MLGAWQEEDEVGIHLKDKGMISIWAGDWSGEPSSPWYWYRCSKCDNWHNRVIPDDEIGFTRDDVRVDSEEGNVVWLDAIVAKLKDIPPFQLLNAPKRIQ